STGHAGGLVFLNQSEILSRPVLVVGGRPNFVMAGKNAGPPPGAIHHHVRNFCLSRAENGAPVYSILLIASINPQGIASGEAGNRKKRNQPKLWTTKYRPSRMAWKT